MVGDDSGKRLVIISSAGRLFMYAAARDISLLCKISQSEMGIHVFIWRKQMAYLEMIV